MTDDTDTTITGRIDDHEFGILNIHSKGGPTHGSRDAAPVVSQLPRGTILAAADFPRGAVRLGDTVDIDVSGDTPFTHFPNAHVDSHESPGWSGEDIMTRIHFWEWVAYGDDFKDD